MPQPLGLAPRRIALDVLTGVLDFSRPLDDQLHVETGHPGLKHLDQRDRALVRVLAATTLRRLGQIDAALDRLLARRPSGRTGRLLHVLRLGTAQILFMGTAPHAAVDLAVRLAALDRRARHLTGLVNGVLRALAAKGAAALENQDEARLNTPDWLWRRWTSAFGEEAARRIAAMHLTEPPLDLSCKADPGSWAARLGAVMLPTGTVRLVPEGPIESLDGFDEGAWWVQDAAAALPARLLMPVSGLRVADLCAAPGGKTAELASAGASVVAVDRAEGRLKRLEANLARLRLSAETVVADVLAWDTDERFDAVLLDAPCTATGTIRRHPDVPHVKRESDVAALAALQARLLDRAVSLLKPGGRLVYCVCSLEPEEGEAQAEALLARTDLKRVPVRPDEIGGVAAVTSAGDLRTLPFQLAGPSARLSGWDGFFAARFTAS
jgi:16S rRNA (cytosine967-C5)-methyltransferase